MGKYGERLGNYGGTELWGGGGKRAYLACLPNYSFFGVTLIAVFTPQKPTVITSQDFYFRDLAY